MVQHKTKGDRKVGVKAVGAVRDRKGKPVKLSVTKPIPHMLEEKGRMVVAMPRAHPGVRVQVKVNKDMYDKTGLPLRTGGGLQWRGRESFCRYQKFSFFVIRAPRLTV